VQEESARTRAPPLLRPHTDDEGSLHRIREIQSYLGDKEMTYKLVHEVAPRYAERQGGYLRILKLGPRHGDNAPMARIELV